MRYPSYLVHFNPNHDPKNGRFTYSKYVDTTGKLNAQGRKDFGVDDALKERKLRKAVSVMSRKLAGLDNTLFWKESEAKLENDIDSAYNNKAFMKDFTTEVKRVSDAVIKSRKDNDDYMDKWIDSPKGTAYDPPDDEYDTLDKELSKSRQALIKKYPQFKDMLELWYEVPNASPEDNLGWHYESWAKDPGAHQIHDLLDPEGFYDESIIDKNNAKISEIKSAIKNEYVNSFIDKWGETEVNKAMNAINIAATGQSWLW